MYQNQLARNSQIQAARQRLAMREGGVPGGGYANVAGCAPMNVGAQWAGGDPYPVYQSVPNMAPDFCPGVPASNAWVRQHLAPMGLIVQADPNNAETCVEVSCRNGRNFYGAGLKSCNECFQAIVTRIETGTLGYNLIGCGDGVDAGYWNTDDCYCPMELGCNNSLSPYIVCFQAFGTPSVQPFLNLTFVGTVDSQYLGCGGSGTIPPYCPPTGMPPGGGGGYLPPGPGGGTIGMPPMGSGL